MLFAVSGLVCWCGISQVIGNSISSSFENAFSIPPRWSTVALVAVAAVLWLFSFSTFLGVLFYARSNVACLFGDSWRSQTAYKLLALAMLFMAGLAFCRKAPPVRAPCGRGPGPSLQARGWTAVKAKAGASSGSAASSLSPRQASSVMRTALMRLAAAARQ